MTAQIKNRPRRYFYNYEKEKIYLSSSTFLLVPGAILNQWIQELQLVYPSPLLPSINNQKEKTVKKQKQKQKQKQKTS